MPRRNDHYGYGRHARTSSRAHEANLQTLVNDPEALISQYQTGPYTGYFVPLISIAGTNGWLGKISVAVAAQRYDRIVASLQDTAASLRQIGTYTYIDDNRRLGLSGYRDLSDSGIKRKVAMYEERVAAIEAFLLELAKFKLRRGINARKSATAPEPGEA